MPQFTRSQCKNKKNFFKKEREFRNFHMKGNRLDSMIFQQLHQEAKAS
jgi:hypothetical protein